MKLAKSLPALFLLSALAGCHVPLRSYRTRDSVIEVPPPPIDNGSGATPEVTVNGPENRCASSGVPICLAFIEVDDMGELWDKVEVDNALRVIEQANKQANAAPGKTDPIVIAFVHGWKNNAGEKNENVKGFKLALQAVYKQFHATHRVIGVYIGWRGNLIKNSWPVAQQLSYYNREAAAVRIPGASLSSALTQIATRTHENQQALAVFIGHSFGGLLLERAVSEATASQIALATIRQQEAEAAAKTDPASNETKEKLHIARLAADSRADLVIFINPAGAATEAKQMLDFLTYNGYRYQPGVPDTGTQPSPDPDEDRPLFVSLTSTADLATKVAMPIGHWYPDLKFKAAGSFRDLSQEPDKKYDLECFDPHKEHPYWWLKTKQEGALDQSSYYMSTAPHMQILQSHVMLKAIGATQMQVSSTGQKINIQDPNAIAQCNRDLFNKQGLDIVSTFRLADTQTCFAVQERPNRCNGTPYWLMEIDPDVVPDHSTIFTQRFISFLIDTYFTTPGGQPLQRLSPRLMQGMQASPNPQ
jgi:hypothetical protein